MGSLPGAARYTLAPGYYLLPLQGNDGRSLAAARWRL